MLLWRRGDGTAVAGRPDWHRPRAPRRAAAGFFGRKPHPILTKWLYLEDSVEDFDRQAEQLVRLVAGRDARIGVVREAK